MTENQIFKDDNAEMMAADMKEDAKKLPCIPKTIPEEDEEADYSDEFDTDLEDSEMGTTFRVVESRCHDPEVCTESYREACEYLNILTVKTARDQLWSRKLELRHVGLGQADTKALAYALSKNTHVEKLNLAENSIGANGVRYITDMLGKNSRITELNLSGNGIGSTGAKALGDLLRTNSHITGLDISNSQLKDTGTQYIAYGLQENIKLKRLNLSGNEISVDGIQSLATALSGNTTLRSLDISWNHIRQKGAVILCKGMQENDGILSLKIAWNGLGFEGSLALKDLFVQNSSLRSLDLTNNRINWECASFLAMGLRENKGLEVLRLGQNPLTMDGCYKLLEAISHDDCQLRFISFEEIPVDSRVAFKAEDISRSREFSIIHGGVVYTRDVFGTEFHKALKKEDPVSLLRRFLNQRSIRVIDLFRTFDTKDRQCVSKDNFIRGLKRIQAPLDDDELEFVSNYFLKKGRNITFKDLANGVRKNYQLERRHDSKKEFQEQKKKEERRRIMAPKLSSIVLPAIQYFSGGNCSLFNSSYPSPTGPSTRASTAVSRATRVSTAFTQSRRTPKTLVETLPPLTRSPSPITEKTSGFQVVRNKDLGCARFADEGQNDVG